MAVQCPEPPRKTLFAPHWDLRVAPQSVGPSLAVLWVKTHVVRLCLPALLSETEPRAPAGWAWTEPCPDLAGPAA